jgi:hypothetical protein
LQDTDVTINAAPTFVLTADGSSGVLLRPEARMRSAAWFLRRTLLGLTLLSIFAFGGAFLLDATIEPDRDGVTASEE